MKNPKDLYKVFVEMFEARFSGDIKITLYEGGLRDFKISVGSQKVKECKNVLNFLEKIITKLNFLLDKT